MATRLACFSYDNQEMVTCLRKLPWQSIIVVQSIYTEFFSIVVEPKLPGAFISEDPEVLLRTGDVPDIPVIMGATKHDGSFILGKLYFSKLAPMNIHKNEVYLKESIVPDLLKIYGVTEEGTGRAMASSIEMTYLSGDGSNRTTWENIMPGLVDLISVLVFKSSLQNIAKILSRRNRTIYLYSFEHHSKNTLWPLYFANKPLPVEPGIAHGDDLMYIFNMPSLKFSEKDEAFSQLFCEMWLNFVKTGNPNQPSAKNAEKWLPYNPSNEPYLKLNGSPNMQYGYRNSWRPNGFQWN